MTRLQQNNNPILHISLDYSVAWAEVLRQWRFRVSSSPTGISFVKWLDSAEVILISTAHNADSVTSVDRSDGKGGKIKKRIPTVAADYNRGMGSVDQHNQMCSYYTYGRRVSKWWQALFFYFVSMLVTNSWVIYKALTKDNKIGILEFQQQIVYHLSSDYNGRKRSTIPSSPKSKAAQKLAHSVMAKSNPKKETCGFCHVKTPSLYCITCCMFLHGVCVEQHCKES